MINKKLAVAALAAVASTVALMGGAQAQGRDQIRIVGSSTVFPFTSAVAETFGRGASSRLRWSSPPGPAAASSSSAPASASGIRT